MAFRIGKAFVGGLLEGGQLLMNDYQKRRAMAGQYALLDAEKKLIAQRDLMAHGYKLREQKAQHLQRMAEILLQNQRQNQPISEEEAAWWEARTEKERAAAMRERAEGNKVEDQQRKELERDVEYLDKRLGEITYTTEAKFDNIPEIKVYPGQEEDYRRLARERDKKLIKLGRLDQGAYARKWEKPNPMDLGLIPQGLRGGATTYGGINTAPTEEPEMSRPIPAPGTKPSFYNE